MSCPVFVLTEAVLAVDSALPGRLPLLRWHFLQHLGLLLWLQSVKLLLVMCCQNQ